MGIRRGGSKEDGGWGDLSALEILTERLRTLDSKRLYVTATSHLVIGTSSMLRGSIKQTQPCLFDVDLDHGTQRHQEGRGTTTRNGRVNLGHL